MISREEFIKLVFEYAFEDEEPEAHEKVMAWDYITNLEKDNAQDK